MKVETAVPGLPVPGHFTSCCNQLLWAVRRRSANSTDDWRLLPAEADIRAQSAHGAEGWPTSAGVPG